MADTALLLVRWAHAVAAVAWVGGGIFYWVALRPALRSGALPPEATRIVGVEFSQLVVFAMWVLVVTGAVLFFTRLAEPTATALYGGVLAVKVALSAWMFFLVVGRRGRSGQGAVREARGRLRGMVDALGHVNTTVILGIIIILLSNALRLIVEQGLEG